MDKKEIRKKVFWAGVSVLLALLSVRAVMSLGNGITWDQILELIRTAKRRYLILALLGMIGFLFFMGAALRLMTTSLGYRTRHRKGFFYACVHEYFSCITPSATGGQPACAVAMVRDGIPLAKATAVLIMNSLFYTLAVLCNGLVCMIFGIPVLKQFSVVSRVLIAVGTLTLTGLAAGAILLLWHQKLFRKIVRFLFALLTKLHLMRHPEKRKEKLEHMMEQYHECVDAMAGKKKMLIGGFLFNLLQRFSQISVTLTIYMALGGSAKNLVRLYQTQSLCVLGSNCAPIPGSMGVTDFLMVDGFRTLMEENMAYRVELFARTTSFYLCMLLAGLVTLAGFLYLRLKRRRSQ